MDPKCVLLHASEEGVDDVLGSGALLLRRVESSSSSFDDVQPDLAVQGLSLPKPDTGQMAKVRYSGWYLDDDKEKGESKSKPNSNSKWVDFEASDESGRWMRVGEGFVVRGIDLALRFLVEGECSVVQMVARLGIESDTDKALFSVDNDHIEASLLEKVVGRTLQYRVELLELGARLPAVADMETKDRVSQATRWKARGNALYRIGNALQATELYTKGMQLLQGLNGSAVQDEAEGQAVEQLHADLGNNLITAYSRAGDTGKAMDACVDALMRHPTNRKTLAKVTGVSIRTNHLEEARLALAKLTALQGTSEADAKATEALAQKLRHAEKVYKKKQKDLFGGFLSKKPKEEKKADKSISVTTTTTGGVRQRKNANQSKGNQESAEKDAAEEEKKKKHILPKEEEEAIDNPMREHPYLVIACMAVWFVIVSMWFGRTVF
jgi:tetratricopeptide (TPR) repeat protein